MLRLLLSDDLPRSRLLTAVLVFALVMLAITPFAFDGAQALNTAAKICVFVVLAASYDLLLGYTGIVSFAHTMFFGIGGYGAGLALAGWGPTWASLAIGIVLALAAGIGLSLVVGLFALRVRAIFFAMMTLAVASAFAILASQLSEFTGGEDGRSFELPAILKARAVAFTLPVLGTPVTGRMLTYYIVFTSALALFLALLRVVNSPFGRALQAIRDNDRRAESLGFRTVRLRVAANCLAAGVAVLAGVLNALWLRYTGPDTTLSFTIMIDILLMVVIGGTGTMYGAAIGAMLLVLTQNYLQRLMAIASEATVDITPLSRLLHPDRWLLWLGVAFVLVVYFFPTGIVGRLRERARATRRQT